MIENITRLEFKALDGSRCRMLSTETLSEIQILPVADEEEIVSGNRQEMPKDCSEVQMMV